MQLKHFALDKGFSKIFLSKRALIEKFDIYCMNFDF